MKNRVQIMFPSEAVARAIYERADQLEHKWRCAGLSAGFRDRMIDAVCRLLSRCSERKGIYPSARFACQLLDAFWRRNAGRNSRRRSQTALVVDENWADRENRFERVYENRMINKLIRLIVSKGEEPAVAWAFVLAHLGLTSQETARLLGRARLGQVSPACIRQWSRRRFPRVLSMLRRHPELFSLPVN